jgi:uncharacterized protein (DUF1786 family)
LVVLKSLALDVGAGTVDILLHREGELLENSVKMVLPSPCKVYAKMIRNATELGGDVLLNGYTIGGGPITFAVKKHVSAGHSVYMTSSAAFTLRNDLDEVRQLGVKIVEDEICDSECVSIFLDEIKLANIEALLNAYGETLKDVAKVAISVKDHGAPTEKMTNREFRMKTIHEMLKDDPDIKRFLLKENNVPDFFLRMKSAVKASKDYLPNAEVVLMDTSPSAIVGCLMDDRVSKTSPVLAVNVGNGHTMAAVVSGTRIYGLYEAHTSQLTGENLVDILTRFADGDLSNSEVFGAGGHGVIYFDDMPGFSGLDMVVVTGPRRGILASSRLDYIQATPGGDVMMTGTIGILAAVHTTRSKSKRLTL